MYSERIRPAASSLRGIGLTVACAALVGAAVADNAVIRVKPRHSAAISTQQWQQVHAQWREYQKDHPRPEATYRRLGAPGSGAEPTAPPRTQYTFDLYNGLPAGGYYWLYVPGPYYALDDGMMIPSAVAAGGGEVTAFEFAFGMHADFAGDTQQPIVYVTFWNAPADPVGGASDPVVDPNAPVASFALTFGAITLPAEGDYVLLTNLIDLAGAGLEFDLDGTFYVEILPLKLQNGIPVFDPNVFAVFSSGPITLGTNQDNMWSDQWVRQGCSNFVAGDGDGRYDHPAELDWGGCAGFENESPIHLVGTPYTNLTLEVPAGCLGDVGDIIEVELWMRNPAQMVTGYQAFLAFDTAALTYRGDLSSYQDVPFEKHIQPITSAEVAPGALNLDGSVTFGAGGTDQETLLATLRFQVAAECTSTAVTFRAVPHFGSEVSFEGTALPTRPLDSRSFYLDNTPPAITCPADATVACDASTDPGATGTATAVDTCDPNPVITYSDVVDLSGCGGYTGTITRTWTATDACGNSSQCVQTITIVDTTPPVITYCPPEATIECDEPTVPGILYGIGTGGVAIYYNHNGGGEDPNNVAYLTAQFSYSDPNTGAAFVFDNTPLDGAGLLNWQDLYSGLPWPESQFGFDFVMTAPSSDGSNPTPTLNAWDNADNTPTGRILVGPVTWAINDYKPHTPDITAGVVLNSLIRSQSPGNQVPDINLTRFEITQSGPIFTADIAGVLLSDGIHHWYNPLTPDSPMSNFGLNGWFFFEGTLTYDSTGDDGSDLVDFYAGSLTMYANSPTIQLGFAKAVDNCDPFPVVTYTDDTSGLTGCDGTGTIVRTWIATDACGNSSTCTQIIHVVDTTPPEITCPADVTIECSDSLDPADTGQATATDNCDADPVITYSDDTSGLTGCDGTGTIVRTWTATDGCGNSASCAQIITLVDTTPPTIDCPANVTIECDDSTDPADTGQATATDNCDAAPAISYSDDTSGLVDCDGTGTIARTWTATDGCGNFSTCVQYITLVDTTPPVITCPPDIDDNADAGTCSLSVDPGMATATDNCDASPVITWTRSDGKTSLTDPYDAADSPITITWTATDGCGNFSTCVQTITVGAVNDVYVTIDLTGQSGPATRCIHFVADQCSAVADVSISFDAFGHFAGWVEIPCGNWTSLCAKDEQHTLWDTAGLTDNGTTYTAGSLTLAGGDTDNDGDVDINDVTWFLYTYAGAAQPGGCPWDGTRDADFSNDGVVGTEDYTILTQSWLVDSGCSCTMALGSSLHWLEAQGASAAPPVVELDADRLPPEVAAAADLNADGVVDWRDVALFEQAHGLPSRLSELIRASAAAQTGPANLPGILP